MPYGQGKMIGDTVDPRLFVQDYSGVAKAAALQAQGYASIGQGIGSAIDQYKDVKKQQTEQEREVKRADKIAALIEDSMPGLSGEIAPIRQQLIDKNIPLKDRVTAAKSISDILNVGVQLKQLQLQEEQIRGKASAGGRPSKLTPVNVPRSDGSSVLMLLDPTTGQVVQPNYGDVSQAAGYQGGGQTMMPDGQQFGGVGMNDPSAWNQDPTLNALSPDMIDIPGQPVISQQVSQAETIPSYLMFPQEAPSAQMLTQADQMVLPAKGEIANAQTQEINTAPSAPVLGVSAPKKSQQQEILTQEQINQLRKENVNITATPTGDGRFYVSKIMFTTPSGMEFEQIPGGGIKWRQGPGVGQQQQKVEEAQKRNATEMSRISTNATEQALSLFDNVVAKTPTGAWLAKGESLAFPAGEAGQFSDALEAIRVMNSKEEIKKMRESSKTGGAAGNMTEKEWPRFEARFGKLDINQKDDYLLRNIQLNALNNYEAINGTPEDVIRSLRDGKITQEDYNDYVDGYSQVRQVAKVDANGIPGAATTWTKFDTSLLKNYTGASQIQGQAQPQDAVDALEQRRKALSEKFKRPQ